MHNHDALSSATALTKPRRKSWTKKSIFIASLLLITSGCVISPEEPSNEDNTNGSSYSENQDGSSQEKDDPSDEIVASSITSSTDFGNGLRIDVYAVEILQNGLLQLRFGVTNNAETSIRINRGLASDDESYTVGAFSLLDTENKKRYLSLEQSDGSCFCSLFDGAVSPGETTDMWVVFPEPEEDPEFVTVTNPLTPPLLDIPVTTSSESVDSSGVGEPQIVDLTIISDNLEEQTGRTESDDEVSILLSSDVLFDTNSAELTEESEDLLEQVAAEIDEASSTTVNIDGHTDNTGNDTTNQPLSSERAESVKSLLLKFITRDGIKLETEGHGASDPIADNNTEEGKERNRRVSVTFER